MSQDRPLTPEEEARLKELLLRSETGGLPDSSIPDTETLEAYLDGTLGPDDVKRVQDALSRSRALRDELLDLADLRDPALGMKLASVLIPHPPPPPFPVPVGQASGRKEAGDASLHGRAGARLRPWFTWGSAGVAVAALIAVYLGRPSAPPFAGPETWESMRSLRSQQFDRDPTRGGLGDLVPRNREQAETLSFLRLLELRDGALVVNPEPGGQLLAESRTLIVLLGQDERHATTHRFHVAADAESLRAAFLSLPDLEVSVIPMDRDTLRAAQPAGSAEGAITVSYVEDGAPRAADATPVSPR